MKPYEKRIRLYRVLITSFCLSYLSYSFGTLMVFWLNEKDMSEEEKLDEGKKTA